MSLIRFFEHPFRGLEILGSGGPDLDPSDSWLLAELKKKFAGKRSASNEIVFFETEAYFEEKYTSFYKTVIEKLKKRCQNIVFLLLSLGTY